MRRHKIFWLILLFIISSLTPTYSRYVGNSKKSLSQNFGELPVLQEGKNIIKIRDKTDLGYRLSLDTNSTYLFIFDAKYLALDYINFYIQIYTFYKTYNSFEEKYEAQKETLYKKYVSLSIYGVNRYRDFFVMDTYRAYSDVKETGYYLMIDITGWDGPTGATVTEITVYIEKLNEGYESINGNKRYEWGFYDLPYRIFKFDLDPGIYMVNISQDTIYNGSPNFMYGSLSINLYGENIISEKFVKVFLNGYLIGTIDLQTGSKNYDMEFDLDRDEANYISDMNIISFVCSLEEKERIVIDSSTISAVTIDGSSYSLTNNTDIILNSTKMASEHIIEFSKEEIKIRYILFDDLIPHTYFDDVLEGHIFSVVTIYKSSYNNLYLLAIPIVKGKVELNMSIKKISVENFTEKTIEVEIDENNTEKFIMLDAESGIWKIRMEYVSGTNWTADLGIWDIDSIYKINTITVGSSVLLNYSWTKIFVYSRESSYTRFFGGIFDLFAISYNASSHNTKTMNIRSYLEGLGSTVIFRLNGTKPLNGSDKFKVKVIAEKIGDISEDLEYEVDGSTEPGLYAVKMTLSHLLYKFDITLNTTIDTHIYAKNIDTFIDIYNEILDYADSSYMELAENKNYLLEIDETISQNITAFMPIMGTEEIVLLFKYPRKAYFKFNATGISSSSSSEFDADRIMKLLEVELPEHTANIYLKSLNTRALIYLITEKGTSAIYGLSLYLYPEARQEVAIKRAGKAYVLLIPNGYEKEISLSIEESKHLTESKELIFWSEIKMWIPIGLIIGVAVYLLNILIRTIRKRK